MARDSCPEKCMLEDCLLNIKNYLSSSSSFSSFRIVLCWFQRNSREHVRRVSIHVWRILLHSISFITCLSLAGGGSWLGNRCCCCFCCCDFFFGAVLMSEEDLVMLLFCCCCWVSNKFLSPLFLVFFFLVSSAACILPSEADLEEEDEGRGLLLEEEEAGLLIAGNLVSWMECDKCVDSAGPRTVRTSRRRERGWHRVQAVL